MPLTAPTISRGEKNPERWARENWWRAIELADREWDDATARMARQQALEDEYRALGYRLYEDELAGRGGYTPEEIARIVREPQTEALAHTRWEDWYMTPEEREVIAGSPEAAKAAFRPEMMNIRHREGGQRMTEALQRGESRLYEAISPELAMRPEFAGMRTRTAEEAARELRTGASDIGGRLISLTDQPGMGLSERFRERFPMTDAERQDILTGAARAAGARYAGLADAIARQAAAEGMGSMGMAARRRRLEDEAASQAAAAMTDARIGAAREAAAREQAMEQMRLGAEQQRAGLSMAALRSAGEMRERAALGAAGLLGEAYTDVERMRLGTEQDIANRRAQAAERLLSSELDTQRYLTGTGMEAERWAQETGIGLESQIDRARSERAAQLAQARMQTERDVARERFQRGMATEGALSDRWRDVAGQRLTGRYRAQDWATQQQEMSQRGYESAADRRIQGQQVAGGLAAKAAGDTLDYRARRPSKFGQIAGTALGAARIAMGAPPEPRGEGGVVFRPTVALIGERGPEAVVPLYPRSTDFVNRIWR